ncbi:hypothetical protein ACIKP7_09790 [Pseudomonas caricapapayae]|uniref:Uncharacterized protein n=1 Tax=Pseudomonas caricapapayae TaxID=46678 RepID=A0ACC7LUB8_9PSED
MFAINSGRKSKPLPVVARGADWAGSCALFMAFQGNGYKPAIVPQGAGLLNVMG